MSSFLQALQVPLDSRSLDLMSPRPPVLSNLALAHCPSWKFCNLKKFSLPVRVTLLQLLFENVPGSFLVCPAILEASPLHLACFEMNPKILYVCIKQKIDQSKKVPNLTPFHLQQFETQYLPRFSS